MAHTKDATAALDQATLELVAHIDDVYVMTTCALSPFLNNDYKTHPIVGADRLTILNSIKIDSGKIDGTTDCTTGESTAELALSYLRVFIDYVYSYYNPDDPIAAPIPGLTKNKIVEATVKYIKTQKDRYNWGYGDSIDRERVRDILLVEAGLPLPLEPSEILGLKIDKLLSEGKSIADTADELGITTGLVRKRSDWTSLNPLGRERYQKVIAEINMKQTS